MSILQEVRDALVARDDVQVVDVYLPQPRYVTSALAQMVYIFVAPKQGLYTVEELQALLDGLLPESINDGDRSQERFRPGHTSGSAMDFGHISFDETVGTVTETGTQTIIITEPDFGEPEGSVDGKRSKSFDHTTQLRRRIFVWLYPDKEYAERAVQGVDERRAKNVRAPNSR